MIRRPPRSTPFPTRRSSDLISRCGRRLCPERRLECPRLLRPVREGDDHSLEQLLGYGGATHIGRHKLSTPLTNPLLISAFVFKKKKNARSIVALTKSPGNIR